MTAHGTWREVVCAGVATAASVRLPPGERWQFAACDGPVTMRYAPGDNDQTASQPLEVLAAPGLSSVHVHPGPSMYVQFLAPAGDRVWVMISPVPADEAR